MNVLFCIPYAGGAASAYSEMKKLAAKDRLEIVPLEYAGHASRIMEPLYESMEEAVEDCYQQIKNYLKRRYVKKYGIFGHSMGSWMVYEAVNRLQTDPEVDSSDVIFISANTVPQVEIQEKTEEFSDSEFWKWIYEQGGLDNQLYEMDEFREYIMPIIRNDYRIMEAYAGEHVEKKYFPMDVNVIGGKDDDISPDELLQWKEFATGKFEIQWFEGNHFYFRDKPEQVESYLSRKMNEI